jgi:very-short-patch-repair endonuclease
VFSDDVRAAASLVTAHARTSGAVIASVFTQLPTLEAAMSRLVEALADGAKACWPAWYGRVFSHTGALDDRLAAPAEIAAVVAEHRDVLERWLDRASAHARRGMRPLLGELALAVQARQLAIAIDARDLRVVTCAAPPVADDASLHALARALEWLAAETGARVTGVLDAELAGREVLDRIGYQSTTLRFAMPEAGDAPPEWATATIHPVIGRPHPLSRVEQRLAQVLGQAEDLRPLFEFNQRIQTARGGHAIVDLIWRAGGVIVEIDGWDTHGNRYSFAGDRHRDYELAISGYLILRLTNDEILEDVAKAVDKIRDVVKFRQIERQ